MSHTNTSSYNYYTRNYERAFRFASWNAFWQAKKRNKLLFINRCFWIGIGKLLAILYSLGCALTIAAAAVAFLCGLTGAIWPGILAGVIMFVAGFVFNIKISWNSTPKVLLDFFGRGRLFKGLTGYYRKNIWYKLSRQRKGLLAFGVFCAIASAFTWAAIGWGEIVEAIGLLLSVSAGSVPPVFLVVTGIIIAGLFVSTATMLIKEMSLMLGKDDFVKRLQGFWQQCKNVITGRYFKNAYTQCKTEHPTHPKQAFIKKLLRDGRNIAIGLVVVGLTVAGLIMVMKTGAAALTDVLVGWSIPAVAATVVAIANCFFFAFSGELPFALGTSMFATNAINKWLKRKKAKRDAHSASSAHTPAATTNPEPVPDTFLGKCKYYSKKVGGGVITGAKKLWPPLHITNAIGNGFIAMKTFMGNIVSRCPDAIAGAGGTASTAPNIPMMIFALLTGFFASYTAGFHGDEADEADEAAALVPTRGQATAVSQSATTAVAARPTADDGNGFALFDLAHAQRAGTAAPWQPAVRANEHSPLLLSAPTPAASAAFNGY